MIASSDDGSSKGDSIILNPSDDAIDSTETDTSTSQCKSPGKKKHVWKAFDPNTLGTKRRYIRRKPRASSSIELTKNEAAKSPEKKKQQLIVVRRSSSLPNPDSDILTGGLRGDPFNAFPVENRGSVQGAVDFLLMDIAAVAIPGTIRSDSFSPKVSAYMQLALEHDICFHAVVAFAQGYQEVAKQGATEPSSVVLYHRGKATEKLYSRLKDPEKCSDDASILTTFLLIDNVWRYGEHDIGKAHYAGLMKMVQIRGGLDNLGLNGILKAVIEFAEVTDLGESLRPPTIPKLPHLQYIGHPFPPRVCSMISQLPEGYTEIAMSGQLSIETITLILSLRQWIYLPPLQRQAAPAKQIGEARRCLSGLRSSTEAGIEHAVCLGVIITAMRMFHARFSRMDHSLLDQIVEIGQQFDQLDSREYKDRLCERRHFAYLAMVAIEASEHCIELRKSIDTLVDMLVRRESFASNWENLEPVLKRYFWIQEGRVAEKWRVSWCNQLQRRTERYHFETKTRKSDVDATIHPPLPV